MRQRIPRTHRQSPAEQSLSLVKAAQVLQQESQIADGAPIVGDELPCLLIKSQRGDRLALLPQKLSQIVVDVAVARLDRHGLAQ